MSGLLAPLAFLHGYAISLALRELDEPPVPRTGGINGGASVVSAAMAILLAVDFGFSGVLWIALAIYGPVLAAFPRQPISWKVRMMDDRGGSSFLVSGRQIRERSP